MESIMETVLSVWDAIPAWVHAITAVVTAAAAITALTPTTKDDAILAKVLKVLNILALNVGKAKNAPPPSP